ncbi:hypothetical protein D9615_008795 [Tricholomella constricta]|uniref:Protein kinase domain-containing protein n=1 Tax=Tricholomella constricta TaxID=117010 RepID=A0A8H5M1X3_9AGAR|nr:hypothetical protein D9615_008795 [Tricholomella constricta]
MPFSKDELRAAFQDALLVNPYLDLEHFIGNHVGGENFWVNLQPFLLHRGYRLRPRYHCDWTAPWSQGDSINFEVYQFEEALTLKKGRNLLDAIRISDGAKVVLKRVETWRDELPIAQYLSSPEIQCDPRNHTVPILDILLLPDDDEHALLVMPQLLLFDQLPFRRLGEFVDALRQYFEVRGLHVRSDLGPVAKDETLPYQGLDFLHEHRIAHKDACYFNLMMDGSKLVPRGVHFMAPDTYDGLTEVLEWHDRSSVGPIKYYFIDFGLSKWFYPKANIVFSGVYGQDRTVPEHKLEEPHDPFKVDIYQLGNVIIQMIRKYEGMEPLLGIATAMTRKKPQDRMSLPDALYYLNHIPRKVLKRRVWRRDCPPYMLSIRCCGGSTKMTS